MTAGDRRARKAIVAIFCAQHGIAPGDAIPFKPQDLHQRHEFERLKAHGIVREAAPGYFWIDLPALDAESAARERRLVPVAIVIAVVLAGVAMLFYRNGSLGLL